MLLRSIMGERNTFSWKLSPPKTKLRVVDEKMNIMWSKLHVKIGFQASNFRETV